MGAPLVRDQPTPLWTSQELSTTCLWTGADGPRRQHDADMTMIEMFPSEIRRPDLLLQQVCERRSVDLLLKRGLYEESGVAAYWVVEPLVPSVQAWALQDGAYVDAGYAEGRQQLHVERPFGATVTPQDLLDP